MGCGRGQTRPENLLQEVPPRPLASATPLSHLDQGLTNLGHIFLEHTYSRLFLHCLWLLLGQSGSSTCQAFGGLHFQFFVLKKKVDKKSLWWNIFLKAEFLPAECGPGLSCVVTPETARLSEPQIFATWLFTEKVCQSPASTTVLTPELWGKGRGGPEPEKACARQRGEKRLQSPKNI